jgi:gas vesicle protein
MKNSTSNATIVKALLAGVVIGGVTGAALGILFAPERGSDMRKRILSSGDELKDVLQGKFNQLVAGTKRGADYVRDKKRSRVENGVVDTGQLK